MGAPVGPVERQRRREALYALLCDLAARGAVCPVGEHLAQAVGCPASSAIETLAQLVRDGLVESKTHWRNFHGGGRVTVFRVVKIVATGQVTGTPTRDRDVSAASAAARPARLLDQAKTFLRSKGPIVFDHSVVAGGLSNRLVHVDRRVCTPAEVIALAEQMGFRAGASA